MKYPKLVLNLLLLILIAMALPAYASPSVLEVDVDHGYSLSLEAPATSVFIANPDIADVQVMSPTKIMIFGKRTGETTFMATDARGQTLAERTVRIVQDLSGLRAELKAAIPNTKIKVASVPNGIVLTGEATDSAAIADAYKLAQRYLSAGGEIVNRVQLVGSNQIQIRVRFAEVDRNIDNTLGINWQNLASFGGFTFGLATGISNMGTGSGIIGTRPNNTALNLPNDVLGLGYQGNRFNVNALIDALAQEGFISILAEPNLTAMSGETANFLAGGEFPIPIPQGNGSISVSFKPYGIGLAFTPTLIGKDRINLHVRPEVSQITTTGSIVLSNITIPALTTRKAETTVEVASGESFAIAGLLDNNQAQTANKYPVLGDLPILGPLFRSDRFKNNQTELVIIITPYIVKPSGERLALPTDGLSPPTDADRLLKLRTSGSNPDARTISGQPTGIHIEKPTASTVPYATEESVPLAQPATPMAAPVAPVEPEVHVKPVTAPSTKPATTNGFMLE